MHLASRRGIRRRKPRSRSNVGGGRGTVRRTLSGRPKRSKSTQKQVMMDRPATTRRHDGAATLISIGDGSCLEGYGKPSVTNRNWRGFVDTTRSPVSLPGCT
jgi:hypothetical protein